MENESGRIIMNKQLSILYFSATDGTAKVVKEIGRGISNNYKEYNITQLKNRQETLLFGPDEMIIVGVPVYAGRVPGFLVDYLMKIKGNDTPAIFITVYGNRDYEDALLELKNIFESNGFNGIASGAFIAEHSNTNKVATNRPDTKDLETAFTFGNEIKDKCQRYPDLSKLPQRVVKGNFPYKERPIMPSFVPSTTDDCIECGICANHCPMEAISYSNYKDIEESCIRCCSCIKRCPVNAKKMEHEVFNTITNRLIDNFSSIRREPELFL